MASASSSSTSKEKQLFNAVWAGDRASLQTVLQAAIDDFLGSQHGDWHQSALHVAAWMGHIDCLSYLVKAGACVDAADKDGYTPLYLAALKGHEACVSLLLEAGAKVDAASEHHGTAPLNKAVSNGHEACVLLLLKAGANVNAADKDGWTPLYHAVDDDDEACVSRLLEAGANVNAADTIGCTPLHLAVEQSREACVPLLLKAGAKLGAAASNGKTRLSLAHGHTAVVAMLQGESRWRRRRALALIREQREAGSDWVKARKEWRHSKIAKC